MVDRNDRLRRCIRDLSALTALPAMCVGRTPQESLDVLVDALPTALDCDLLYFVLPGPIEQERGSLDRASLSPEQLEQVRAASTTDGDGADGTVFVGGEKFWCMETEIPFADLRGKLLVGRRAELDGETDRVLVRTAANLVGTIIQSANVLEVARRKDDFLAMLGHELRNPLAPIVTAVELLKLNPSAARERDVIERHAQHMVRIVDDLLDISRVTRGHIELRREHVPLSSILQRAVEMASPLVTRNQHRLEVAEAHDAVVQGDPIRLAQVFGNLLTNAAKFTPPGGRIDVHVEHASERVRVVVRDTGCGIAKDQQQRIFEPFVQADRARDVLRGGLGLGLAIVHNLVTRHGGSISLRSDGYGTGSEFTVELPMVDESGVTASTPRRAPSETRANIRVLVVDDNTDIAELLSEALQGKGFQTAVANDGRNALISWRAFLPHAGVFDVGLPDVDGYDIARAVRSEYGAEACLIAMTGYGQPTDRSRAAEAGFDRHMVKPVSLEELVRVLDECVPCDKP
ncbi:MAG TPA: hybrid sensor histidine kinase/response regulator [Kofleriaceae bacterium]|nr:hybrid sensor histidine kinase/response regulator [Kofleriaceae bacterium]